LDTLLIVTVVTVGRDWVLEQLYKVTDPRSKEQPAGSLLLTAAPTDFPRGNDEAGFTNESVLLQPPKYRYCGVQRGLSDLLDRKGLQQPSTP
jgi:hypothetical protein